MQPKPSPEGVTERSVCGPARQGWTDSMKRLSFFVAGLAGLALGIGFTWHAGPAENAVTGLAQTLGSVTLFTPAVAQPARRSVRRTARRTSRRTARRTSARYNYYNRLPAGCVWRSPYHYCGGVYYQQVVHNGAQVYIIVTP